MQYNFRFRDEAEFRAIMQSLPYIGGNDHGTIFIEKTNTNAKKVKNNVTNHYGIQAKGNSCLDGAEGEL
jgi:hypothetical protein